MDILAIEWSHESAVDSVDDVAREIVGFVLQPLYLGDVALDLSGILEQLLQKLGATREAARKLPEHVVELLVPRNESHFGLQKGFRIRAKVTSPKLAKPAIAGSEKPSRAGSRR